MKIHYYNAKKSFLAIRIKIKNYIIYIFVNCYMSLIILKYLSNKRKKAQSIKNHSLFFLINIL